MIIEQIENNSIFIIHDVLDKNECLEMIELAESIGFSEATVSLPEGAKLMKSVRNNQRVTIDDENIANMIWLKIKSLIPKVDDSNATRLNYRIRFYKYSIGQRFNRHIDGVYKEGEEESKYSFLIYLNNDFEGGETEFDIRKIKPNTGSALCFEHNIKHKGCKVEKGIKYVLRTDIMFK